MLHLTLPLLIGLLLPMHTRLARSEPAADAVVATSPRQLQLWFEGGVEAAFTQVTLHGSSGAQFALGAPTTGEDDGLVVVQVSLRLPADRYTVSWETVGRDGHVIRGSYRFALSSPDGSVPTRDAPAALDSTAWGAGAAGRTVPGAPVTATAPIADGSRVPRAAGGYASGTRPVRWAELSALVAALGAVALLLGVMQTGRGGPAHERFVVDAARRVTALAVTAAAVFLIAAGVRFALESHVLHGGSGGWSTAGLARTASTAWGRAWIVSVVSMAVVLGALLHRRRAADAISSTSVGSDLVLGLAALVAAVGPAMTGHAASSASLMPLAVLADWLHVIGASAWVGGVAGLALGAAPAALAQPRGDRAPAMAWLVGAFHAIAVPSIALVVLSGVVSAWLRVGTWRELVASNYGDLLLFKVYLVALVALLGGYHWLRVRPRLLAATGDDDRAARRLQWTLRAEVAVSAIVVAITAALVTTAPPR